MSVRLRKWKTKEGTVLERWTIDVKLALPGKPPRRVRDFSPVNSRRGALQHERTVRQALGNISYRSRIEREPVREYAAYLGRLGYIKETDPDALVRRYLFPGGFIQGESR